MGAFLRLNYNPNLNSNLNPNPNRIQNALVYISLCVAQKRSDNLIHNSIKLTFVHIMSTKSCDTGSELQCR